MSYARSPRPVCSMTMGTKLAFMGAELARSDWERFYRHCSVRATSLRRLVRHDLGLGHHQRERALAAEAVAERVARLRTLVECADSLRRLLLTLRERVNFGIHHRVVDRD